MHGVFAFLVALVERSRSGRGHHIESTMVESALNVAAEQVLEWSANGELLQRNGNRSPMAAPQGLYPCTPDPSGAENWLALSITRDEEWRSLRTIMGEPDWSRDPELESAEGRHRAHEIIDQELTQWTARQDRTEIVDKLRAVDIKASEVISPARILESNPQLRERNYFETPDHPVVGAMPMPSLPFRYASLDHWLHSPAPTLGQHNEDILERILGLSKSEMLELSAQGVIGKRLEGA
jgi:crotonobetainyl-CoA:carnitine CoA-transferase CaiB-like acyl-CoA transferase